MQKFIIILIFVVALTLRLWNISSLPSSLSIDEVTFGYAGYSVLNTAHDEFGRFLPLAFEGIGDFKPPVDVYLNVITEKIFGLNEFAVRIHGVVLGALTCIIVVFLLKEIGLNIKESLFGGFWLAISGWHIFFSRAGYEAITALFFLTIAVFFFLRAIRVNKKLFIYLSLILFSLSVWSYHAERIFVPILFVFLCVYFRHQLLKLLNRKGDLILIAVIFIVFAVPFIYLLLFSKDISARALNLWIGNSSHNGNIVEAFVGQYLNYFDLRFLFWKGLALTPKNFQDMGIFNIFDLPLVILGIYGLIKSKSKYTKTLLVFWLLTFPIPGAFARGDPSPIRALIVAPVFAALVGIGFEVFLKKFKRIFLIILATLLLIGLFYFFDLYIYAFPKYNADVWNYGYKEVAQYACANYQKYNKIIITDKYGIELPNVKTVPHYYVLFYCKWNPSVYLTDKSLYNIEIRQPQWRIDSKLKNTLLIGSRWDFPENFDMTRVIKTIYFLNGKAAFYFVETK